MSKEDVMKEAVDLYSDHGDASDSLEDAERRARQAGSEHFRAAGALATARSEADQSSRQYLYGSGSFRRHQVLNDRRYEALRDEVGAQEELNAARNKLRRADEIQRATVFDAEDHYKEHTEVYHEAAIAEAELATDKETGEPIQIDFEGDVARRVIKH